jgi:hypothetical protein
MPSEQEDARARQLEALRRYMAHPDTRWEPPAELGLVHGQAGLEAARPGRRPGRAWLLITGLLVAAAMVGGVVVGAVAWSDDRPTRATAAVTATSSTEAGQADAGGAAAVATPACKTAVDRANTMLASAVKLRGVLGEQDRLLADPANRAVPVGQLVERLAAARQATSDESARFDRALEAYRQVVDRCDLRVP